MPVTVNGISCTLAGGVRETTQTTGTGTYSVDGAATVDGITYRTIVAAIGSGGTSVFTVRLGSAFETFIGTVTSGAPATLTRDTILESSNGGNAVNWGAGVKDVFLDAAAAIFHSVQDQIDTRIPNSIKVTTFTSSGTWNRDAKCLFGEVEVIGCGGGGGGAAGGAAVGAGGGGGAGGYAWKAFSASGLGSSQEVTIGAIGAGGTDGGAGGSGGSVSFGALLSASGGGGGSGGGSSSSTARSGAPGDGGVGSNGTINASGGSGDFGARFEGTTACSGKGGDSRLGGGGRAVVEGSTGLAGAANSGGGGSGGASNGATARSGGSGAAGICIVKEYLHI